MTRYASRSSSRRSPEDRSVQRELMPLSEAAALVSRTPRTLRRWMAKGLLTGFKLSGLVMVRPADLKALIERSRDSMIAR